MNPCTMSRLLLIEHLLSIAIFTNIITSQSLARHANEQQPPISSNTTKQQFADKTSREISSSYIPRQQQQQQQHGNEYESVRTEMRPTDQWRTRAPMLRHESGDIADGEGEYETMSHSANKDFARVERPTQESDRFRSLVDIIATKSGSNSADSPVKSDYNIRGNKRKTPTSLEDNSDGDQTSEDEALYFTSGRSQLGENMKNYQLEQQRQQQKSISKMEQFQPIQGITPETQDNKYERSQSIYIQQQDNSQPKGGFSFSLSSTANHPQQQYSVDESARLKTFGIVQASPDTIVSKPESLVNQYEKTQVESESQSTYLKGHSIYPSQPDRENKEASEKSRSALVSPMSVAIFNSTNYNDTAPSGPGELEKQSDYKQEEELRGTIKTHIGDFFGNRKPVYGLTKTDIAIEYLKNILKNRQSLLREATAKLSQQNHIKDHLDERPKVDSFTSLTSNISTEVDRPSSSPVEQTLLAKQSNYNSTQLVDQTVLKKESLNSLAGNSYQSDKFSILDASRDAAISRPSSSLIENSSVGSTYSDNKKLSEQSNYEQQYRRNNDQFIPMNQSVKDEAKFTQQQLQKSQQQQQDINRGNESVYQYPSSQEQNRTAGKPLLVRPSPPPVNFAPLYEANNNQSDASIKDESVEQLPDRLHLIPGHGTPVGGDYVESLDDGRRGLKSIMQQAQMRLQQQQQETLATGGSKAELPMIHSLADIMFTSTESNINSKVPMPRNYKNEAPTFSKMSSDSIHIGNQRPKSFSETTRQITHVNQTDNRHSKMDNGSTNISEANASAGMTFVQAQAESMEPKETKANYNFYEPSSKSNQQNSIDLYGPDIKISNTLYGTNGPEQSLTNQEVEAIRQQLFLQQHHSEEASKGQSGAYSNVYSIAADQLLPNNIAMNMPVNYPYSSIEDLIRSMPMGNQENTNEYVLSSSQPTHSHHTTNIDEVTKKLEYPANSAQQTLEQQLSELQNPDQNNYSEGNQSPKLQQYMHTRYILPGDSNANQEHSIVMKQNYPEPQLTNYQSSSNSNDRPNMDILANVFSAYHQESSNHHQQEWPASNRGSSNSYDILNSKPKEDYYQKTPSKNHQGPDYNRQQPVDGSTHGSLPFARNRHNNNANNDHIYNLEGDQQQYNQQLNQDGMRVMESFVNNVRSDNKPSAIADTSLLSDLISSQSQALMDGIASPSKDQSFISPSSLSESDLQRALDEIEKSTPTSKPNFKHQRQKQQASSDSSLQYSNKLKKNDTLLSYKKHHRNHSNNDDDDKKKSLIVYLNHPRLNDVVTPSPSMSNSNLANNNNIQPASLVNNNEGYSLAHTIGVDEMPDLTKLDSNGQSTADFFNSGSNKTDTDGLSVVVVGDAHKYKKIILLISSKSGGLKFLPMVKETP